MKSVAACLLLAKIACIRGATPIHAPCKQVAGDSVVCNGSATLDALESVTWVINPEVSSHVTFGGFHLDAGDYFLSVRLRSSNNGSVAATVALSEHSLMTLPAGNGSLDALLFCNTASSDVGFGSSSSLAVIATATEKGKVDLELEISAVVPNVRGDPSSFAAGSPAWLRAFRVDREVAQFGEASFHFESDAPTLSASDEQSPAPSAQAFVFPSSSPCLRQRQKQKGQPHGSVAAVGCTDMAILQQCLQRIDTASPTGVLSMTFGQRGTIPVNSVSQPPLAEGSWYVFLAPDRKSTVDRSFAVTLERGASRRWSLVALGFAMVILPVTVLCAIDALTEALKKVWRACRFHSEAELSLLWVSPFNLLKEWSCLDSGFRAFLRESWTESIHGSGYTLLTVVAGTAFFTCALQLSVTKWKASQASGERDTCFYNFDCYVPWGVDLPFNNILSHGPYFACSMVVFGRILHEDYKNRRISPQKVPPNLQVMYAMATSLFLEGFGSICFHICPSPIVFQFDSAMMFVIAALSGVALVDIDKEAASTMPPILLFMGVILPMWLFSFVGTWFQIDDFESQDLYIVYSLAVILWCLFIVWRSADLFPDAGCCSWIPLRLLLGAGFIATVVDRSLGSAGMSTILLGLSIVVMMIVSFRQIVRHDVRVLRCTSCPSVHQINVEILHVLVKFGLMGIFFVVAQWALVYFIDSPTDKALTPAASRDLNRGCVFLDAFDAHDVWHMLSAIAVSLWILLLLDVRVRVWKRQLPPPSDSLEAISGQLGGSFDLHRIGSQHEDMELPKRPLSLSMS